LVFYFQTPWNTPRPVLEQLVNLHRDIDFTIYCYEESHDFCYVIEIKDKKLTHQMERQDGALLKKILKKFQ